MGINLINDNLIAANVKATWFLSNSNIGPSTNSGVITYDNLQPGSVGDWVNSSGYITIPETGWYDISAGVASSGAAFSNLNIDVHVGGGPIRALFAVAASGTLYNAGGSDAFYATKGDTLIVTASNDYSCFTDYRSSLTITRKAEYTAGQPAGFGLGTELLYGLNKSQMRFCHIYSTTDQNGNADNATITKIFDSISSDVHGMADLGNNRIVPNLPGVYWIGASGVLSSISNNTSITHQLYTRINGGGPNFSSARSGNDSSGNLGGAFIHYHYANGIYQFNGTTDYVDVAMTFDTVGGTWNSSSGGEGGGFLIVAYLGPLPSLT
jgi:hypothetical protein